MIFKRSFDLIWDNFGYFLACTGLDVLFFFALGFFTAPVSVKMKTLLLQITAVFSEGLTEVDSTETVLDILFDSQTMVFWKPLVLYALLFIFIIYLVYIIFQSVSWNLSLRIINKKIKYLSYLKSFALLNLFWFLIFIVYNLIDLIGNLRIALSSVKTINFVSIFANFFLLIMIYFAIISYVKLNFRKSFVLGWKKYRPLLSIYVLVLFYFFILNFILSKLFLLSYTSAVIIGLVFLLPAISWARIFFALNIDRVK
ncbi:hypothetical protein JW851_00895 [Candidatus Woesearchaeota archaeon]|nr:hypothetical protein [Candidatus Woesearchaeota archaeon]